MSRRDVRMSVLRTFSPHMHTVPSMVVQPVCNCIASHSPSGICMTLALGSSCLPRQKSPVWLVLNENCPPPAPVGGTERFGHGISGWPHTWHPWQVSLLTCCFRVAFVDGINWTLFLFANSFLQTLFISVLFLVRSYKGMINLLMQDRTFLVRRMVPWIYL
jgi:hypothetical protein